MSRRRVYSQDSLDIMARFFFALDVCIKTGRLKNISNYCDSHNIDRRHFAVQKKDIGRGYFEVGWLKTLVDDCDVSSYWLLTGVGNMFTK